ncbi:MAG: hypothetical protein C4345_12865, partial [Chloroflexota bacterium]
TMADTPSAFLGRMCPHRERGVWGMRSYAQLVNGDAEARPLRQNEVSVFVAQRRLQDVGSVELRACVITGPVQ